MKVYKHNRIQVVNDGGVNCLVLNYSLKNTLQGMFIHGYSPQGIPILYPGWEYVREATPEEEQKFNEKTKYR